MGVRRVYKASAPYNAAELSGVAYTQTKDVVYMAHLDYPVQKLVREGHTDWVFSEVVFGPTIGIPTGIGSAASSPNMTGFSASDHDYVVTAIDDDLDQESRASAVTTVSNDLSLDGNFNTITWSAVSGADRYVVYKGNNGIYGYIGGTTGLEFVDNNIIAILSDTPPAGENPFSGADNNPSAIEFHEQRLFFGRTRNKINAVWGSQSADFENMDKSKPARPDDAVSFALTGKGSNAVNHLGSLGKDLIVLTSDNVFAINGGEGSPITPAAIAPERQSGRGASRLRPLTLDRVLFYQPSKAKEVRALGFSFEAEGYETNNVALFSYHLLDTYRIIRWAYQEQPYSCVWALRADGVLLCFTWEQEQQVWGWTRMDIDGTVEDVAVITEGGYDRLYILVRRTINGVVRRFHERLALPHVDDVTTACHLDCSYTQVTETATDVCTGLWHLEGATVWATYDGYVAEDLVVEDGRITLPGGYTANIITVGLPYEGRVETLRMVLNTNGGSAHVSRQNIEDVVIRVVDSAGLEVKMTGGQYELLNESHILREEEIDEDEAHSTDYRVTIPGHWSDGPTLTMRQRQPKPVHITAVFVKPVVSSR
jgi:hypothetical protein